MCVYVYTHTQLIYYPFASTKILNSGLLPSSSLFFYSPHEFVLYQLMVIIAIFWHWYMIIPQIF